MKRLIIAVLIVMAVLTGCAKQAPTVEENTQLANPASEYCVEMGGTLQIKDTPEGQVGYCTLADGTVCEEWAYLRDQCPTPE